MEGSISCFVSIFTILIASTSAIQDPLFCCEFELMPLNMSSRRCEGGRHLLLSCDEISSVPYLAVDETYFTPKNEWKYFMVNASHQGLLSPFCLAHIFLNGAMDKNLSVIFCKDEKPPSRRHQQLKFHQEILDKANFENPELNQITCACLMSGVMLAVGALVYISFPVSQQLEEKLIFNVALTQSLFFLACACASIALRTGFVEAYLGTYCAIFWYLFVFFELSSFMWSAVLTYHLRKSFRENKELNGFKRFCQYAMVGYGVPALLMALCIIHVHANSYFRQDILELTCNAQFDLLSSYYGILPLIIISLINVYLFVSLDKFMKNLHASSPEYSVTSMERFLFRLVMNRKLFTLLVVPWLVIAFLSLPMTLLKALLEQQQSTLVNCVDSLISGIYCFLSLEGVFMFYMMIMNHHNL